MSHAAQEQNQQPTGQSAKTVPAARTLYLELSVPLARTRSLSTLTGFPVNLVLEDTSQTTHTTDVFHVQERRPRQMACVQRVAVEQHQTKSTRSVLTARLEKLALDARTVAAFKKTRLLPTASRLTLCSHFKLPLVKRSAPNAQQAEAPLSSQMMMAVLSMLAVIRARRLLGQQARLACASHAHPALLRTQPARNASTVGLASIAAMELAVRHALRENSHTAEKKVRRSSGGLTR